MPETSSRAMYSRTMIRKPPLQLRLVPPIVHCSRHIHQLQIPKTSYSDILNDIPALLNQLYAPTASEVARTKTKQEAKLNLIVARHFFYRVLQVFSARISPAEMSALTLILPPSTRCQLPTNPPCRLCSSLQQPQETTKPALTQIDQVLIKSLSFSLAIPSSMSVSRKNSQEPGY